MDVETIFLQHQHGAFYDHLRFFLRITSLADAIDAAIQMKGFEQTIKKKLIKQTSYPILLFVMALATLYVFSVFIIPQLMQSFDMETSNPALLMITKGLEYGAIFLIVLVICLVLFLVACMRNGVLRYRVGKQLLRITSFPADVCSYTLAGYLIQLQTQGVATQAAFQFLTEVKKDSWFTHCVQDLTKALEAGSDVCDAYKEQPFIDDGFLKSWQIGVYTQQMTSALDDFMKRQENSWFRLVKTIGVGIQCGAYTFVAIMVLLVYQIMLVPMQILETM